MRAAVTAQEMRAAEQEAASRGLTSQALMQLAGRAAAQALHTEGYGRNTRFLVLVGPGNNGGDALVVAALLRQAGSAVRLATYRRATGETGRPDPPGTTVLQDVERFPCDTLEGLDRLRQSLEWGDVLIDGLLGTGRSRPPESDLSAVLQALREAPPRLAIIALDLPTGVDADSGSADRLAVQATLTLTFGYVKRGLLLYPARAHCGEIRVLDIGLPLQPAVSCAAVVPDGPDVREWLPLRRPTVHKYSAGAVLAIAGSPHYVGAPVLACRAALRCGAGYVTLALPEEAFPVIAGQLLEVTMVRLPATQSLDVLREVSSRYAALLIGPGLGRGVEQTRLVLDVLSGALRGPRTAVVDADGLFALASTADWPARVQIPLVLTPHTGEMARLTGRTSDEIEQDRFAVATTYAQRWQQVVVLKGAPTIVAAPDGMLAINPTGNPLLATAGTGDVLSGCIAALLAAGSSPYDAARAGVYLHGLAADQVRGTVGDRGMLAGDLLDVLPRAIQSIQNAESSLSVGKS